MRSLRTLTLTAVCAAAVAGSFAAGRLGRQAEPTLPPGWTAADMQACMLAGKPGKQHEWMSKLAGEWTGTTTMWMAEGMPPMKSDCKQTNEMILDGHYLKSDMSGEIPGMGAMKGMGLMGYDNVSGKWNGSWIDNQASGIMQGTGTMSDDGKTLTWSYGFTCPVTKKPVVMREIQSFPDDKTMTLEMWSPDPKTGKEFKCMFVEFKRK